MGDSARRILRGWGVERVKPARIGEEPEHRLGGARVTEQVSEGGRLESKGGEKDGALGGVERAVEDG